MSKRRAAGLTIKHSHPIAGVEWDWNLHVRDVCERCGQEKDAVSWLSQPAEIQGRMTTGAVCQPCSYELDRNLEWGRFGWPGVNQSEIAGVWDAVTDAHVSSEVAKAIERERGYSHTLDSIEAQMRSAVCHD